MAAPTMRERVLALRRGLRRSDLIGAILGLDAAEVASTLTDASHQPPSPGGSGAPGAPVVRKFPFAFDTPGLAAGAPLYTPTVGDWLLDAWVKIVTPWDGTNPFGDVSTFVTVTSGWFAGLQQAAGVPVFDMSGANFNVSGSPSQIVSLAQLSAFAGGVIDGLVVSGPAIVWKTQSNFALDFTGAATPIELLGDPIKMVVSQDGTAGGADPGSTTGSAILYLMTATSV